MIEKDAFHHPSSVIHHLTLRQLLAEAVQALKLAGVASPEVDARELVLHSLGLSRTALLTRSQDILPMQDTEKVRALIARRAQRIPLQHLLGEVEWGGVRLKTDGRALVPRPETEMLLELALRESKGLRVAGVKVDSTTPTAHNLRPTTILDIGTGTGALALALKKALPHAQVAATDLSAEALALARENATLNGLEVNWVQTNLTAGVRGPFDLIVSNPPYLPAADRETADPEVRHDPELALYSGADGLDLARPLVAQAEALLAPDGVLLLELDPRNVAQMAAEMQGWNVDILPDMTGRERFLRARRANVQTT